MSEAKAKAKGRYIGIWKSKEKYLSFQLVKGVKEDPIHSLKIRELISKMLDKIMEVKIRPQIRKGWQISLLKRRQSRQRHHRHVILIWKTQQQPLSQMVDHGGDAAAMSEKTRPDHTPVLGDIQHPRHYRVVDNSPRASHVAVYIIRQICGEFAPVCERKKYLYILFKKYIHFAHDFKSHLISF